MNNDFEKNPIINLKVMKKKMIIHNLKPKNKKKIFADSLLLVFSFFHFY